MERWKAVPGFEGAYEVSDQGRVRSMDRIATWIRHDGRLGSRRVTGKVLQPYDNGQGYARVDLAIGVYDLVHRLVANAFLEPKPTPAHEVRHLNGQRADNRVENLAWGTHGKNMQDTKWYHPRDGLHKLTAGRAREIKIALQRPYYGQLTALGRKYGVNRTTISSIRDGRIHVDVEVAA